ncbi:glycosyltransferase family 4 protein [Chroococcus sp. FPU101]|uniref:glycosyltransferase family 4 protein n=1 Tax=Chroococcus sp. FPU101 TaxID=1974212 RepID=UPI001A90AA7D|nr:glycosyltransferase family 4 protein [Chroococcus sp. FPU101]GFE68208.1 glycosyl transferase group 1 [Chroococcus sp. FPU101]
MKIAFVSTNDFAPWGGSEELWSQTAMRMVSEGYRVGINIKAWNPEALAILKLEQAGCLIVRRENFSSPLQRLITKLQNTQRDFAFLDRFKPELVVISQGGNSDGLSWMEACIAKNIPFVVISQAVAESFWPNDELAQNLAQAYAKAKYSYFVSRANLQLTQMQIATTLKNSKIIANPFNVSYDVKVKWPDENQIFKLACVARLEPFAKGHDILFKLLNTDKWKNRPIQVSLFGNGTNQKSLSKLKELWNLKNVVFSGFTNNVEAIWETHQALILPSRFEGLPIALVEAMLCARPCIVTDVGGNSELIEDGVSGFIAIAPKVECLDDTLERAWQQRHSWDEIGQNAAIRVRKLIPRDPIEVFTNELKSLIE